MGFIPFPQFFSHVMHFTWLVVYHGFTLAYIIIYQPRLVSHLSRCSIGLHQRRSHTGRTMLAYGWNISPVFICIGISPGQRMQAYIYLTTYITLNLHHDTRTKTAYTGKRTGWWWEGWDKAGFGLIPNIFLVVLVARCSLKCSLPSLARVS